MQMQMHHARNTGTDMRKAPTPVLLETAAEIVAKSTQYSTIFDPNREARLPRFSKDGTACFRVRLVASKDAINVKSSFFSI